MFYIKYVRLETNKIHTYKDIFWKIERENNLKIILYIFYRIIYSKKITLLRYLTR